MTDPLKEALQVRLRKQQVQECLYEAGAWIDKIFWLHPNGFPVYLDYYDRLELENMLASAESLKKAVLEILERHKEAEEAL